MSGGRRFALRMKHVLLPITLAIVTRLRLQQHLAGDYLVKRERRHEGIGRPCPHAHPELLPRLVFEWCSEAVGGSPRSRDQARRDGAAAESTRENGHTLELDWRSLFLQTRACRSGAKAAPIHSRKSGLSALVPCPRCLLCADGTIR